MWCVVCDDFSRLRNNNKFCNLVDCVQWNASCNPIALVGLPNPFYIERRTSLGRRVYIHICGLIRDTGNELFVVEYKSHLMWLS